MPFPKEFLITEAKDLGSQIFEPNALANLNHQQTRLYLERMASCVTNDGMLDSVWDTAIGEIQQAFGLVGIDKTDIIIHGGQLDDLRETCPSAEEASFLSNISRIALSLDAAILLLILYFENLEPYLMVIGILMPLAGWLSGDGVSKILVHDFKKANYIQFGIKKFETKNVSLTFLASLICFGAVLFFRACPKGAFAPKEAFLPTFLYILSAVLVGKARYIRECRRLCLEKAFLQQQASEKLSLYDEVVDGTKGRLFSLFKSSADRNIKAQSHMPKDT